METSLSFFASNDMLGLAALQMAQIEGLEVHVICRLLMDDLFSAESASPALTSVSKHRFEVVPGLLKICLTRLTVTAQRPRGSK